MNTWLEWRNSTSIILKEGLKPSGHSSIFTSLQNTWYIEFLMFIFSGGTDAQLLQTLINVW